MALRINTNVGALNAHRQLTTNDINLGKSLQRLSSGLRINGAADDAAGLTIAEKMNSQVRGLNQAGRNAQDSISMLQTAEGALIETEAILQRMRELSVQGANDTLTASDRAAITTELTQLASEVDRIATTTEFNTQKLLNGGGVSSSGLTLQVGANAGQTINVTINTATSSALGVTAASLDVTSAANASTTIGALDTAIASVSESRSKLGAFINRLDHTIKNLSVSAENLSAAESRIRDLDMAAEVMTMTRNQILTQSSTSMLAQANQSTQGVLGLLR
jgi:flagellin